MNLPSFPCSPVLEEAVEAFEAALRDDPQADICTFLPEASHPDYLVILCELLRIDMEYGLENGARKCMDEYRRRFPALFENSDLVAVLTSEEARLRQQRDEAAIGANHGEFLLPGDSIDSDAEALLALSATHQIAVDNLQHIQRDSPQLAGRLAKGLADMPEAGTEFLGFHLEKELGRGAFGRVFLARQAALANRLVALKIAPDAGGESQTLAQLQHTHIVPVYSVHHADSLQAVCMPFMGSLTLLDILREIKQRARMPNSGTELLSSLLVSKKDKTLSNPALKTDSANDPPVPPPANSAIVKKLENWNYIQAVLWLGSCLADGLAHAHERGILHRDLKPANVLITDEGQPMLLDFNLAADTKLSSLATLAMVGGTLPYMAPEHLEAFSGVKRRVDARSDIYALGLILSELVTASPSFPYPDKSSNPREVIQSLLTARKRLPPSPRRINSAISPASAAIILKCLDPDPGRRYQSARELQEDLQRQLEHRPLRHAREASVRERIQKRLKRSPRLLTRVAVGAAACLLVLAVVFGFRWHQMQQRQHAEAAYADFNRDFTKIQFALNTQDDWQEQTEKLDLCRQSLRRFAVFDDPNWQRQALFSNLDEGKRNRLEKNIGSLLLLYVRSGLRRLPANSPQQIPQVKDYLRLNREAERCLSGKHPSAAVLLQRAELLQRLQKTKEADALRTRAEKLPLKSVQDLYIRAQDYTIIGKYRQAQPLLLEAVRKGPRDYWSWFLLGICYDGLSNNREAVKAYTVCIALDPGHHGAYFNRGLAYLRERDYAKARADFTEVIGRNAEKVKSHVNRALAWRGLKEYAKADKDLTQALKLGAETRVYFLRARVKYQIGDKKGYDADMAEGMRKRPADEKSWIARGLARARKDAKGALADFDEALKLNPYSRAAWNNKAFVFAKYVKDPLQAIKMLDKVTQYYPDYAPAFSGRGVLYGRLGQRQAALRDAQAALDRDRRPPILYQVGCIYALTSKTNPADRIESLQLLSSALRQGFGAQYIPDDDDLDPLRQLPEFQRLRAAAATLRKSI